MKAVREDGTEVKSDETITDFRGENWIFVRVSSPSKIQVKKGTSIREFYPTVFKLSIEGD